MRAAVLDVSSALTWCFDEPADAQPDAPPDRVCQDGAVASRLRQFGLASPPLTLRPARLETEVRPVLLDWLPTGMPRCHHLESCTSAVARASAPTGPASRPAMRRQLRPAVAAHEPQCAAQATGASLIDL